MQQVRLWLSKLGGDISIFWEYSVPPGYNRVEVVAEKYGAGASVKSRFKKDLNLQIHIPTEDIFFWPTRIQIHYINLS